MTNYERARTRFGPGSGYIGLAHGARGTAKRTDSMHTRVSRYGGHNADQEAAAIAFTGRPASGKGTLIFRTVVVLKLKPCSLCGAGSCVMFTQ